VEAAGERGDPGWFGPASVAWRVHADMAMLVAGISAFALQALDPRALAGVVDHSSFADDFFGRTRRTGEFAQGVVYGSAAEAARRCLTVRRVHDRVAGTSPDGRPYSANDAELLGWVHVAEYLAIAAANRRFAARPMNGDELDRYVAEVACVAEALGVDAPPRSWAELDAAFESHRPQLAVGEQAAAAVGFLSHPPGLPLAVRPGWQLLWSGAVACLPPVARRLLGLRMPTLAEVAACRAMVRSLGRLLGPPPPLLLARRRLA
jgi:uncharacterized protein (DUF2236 family)